MNSLNPHNWIGTTLDGRYFVESVNGIERCVFMMQGNDRRTSVPVTICAPTFELLRNYDCDVSTVSKRLNLQAKKLRSINHPNIINILDLGWVNDVPFVITPRLAGGSLRDRIDESKFHFAGSRTKHVIQDLKIWLLTLAKALDFVHSRNQCHGELSPTKILFDKYGEPHLAPFAIFEFIESSERELARPLDFAHAAPEAPFDFREGSPSADQYSLAASILEYALGNNPFLGETSAETILRHFNLPASEYLNGIASAPEHFTTSLGRALSIDPSQRFPTCSAFAEAMLFGDFSGNRQIDSETTQPKTEPPVDTAMPTASGPPHQGYWDDVRGIFVTDDLEPAEKIWRSFLNGVGILVLIIAFLYGLGLLAAFIWAVVTDLVRATTGSSEISWGLSLPSFVLGFVAFVPTITIILIFMYYRWPAVGTRIGKYLLGMSHAGNDFLENVAGTIDKILGWVFNGKHKK